MNEWQPIESAPKDEYVLVSVDDETVYIAIKYYDYDDDWFAEGCRISPSHWQPLPAPHQG